MVAVGVVLHYAKGVPPLPAGWGWTGVLRFLHPYIVHSELHLIPLIKIPEIRNGARKATFSAGPGTTCALYFYFDGAKRYCRRNNSMTAKRTSEGFIFHSAGEMERDILAALFGEAGGGVVETAVAKRVREGGGEAFYVLNGELQEFISVVKARAESGDGVTDQSGRVASRMLELLRGSSESGSGGASA